MKTYRGTRGPTGVAAVTVEEPTAVSSLAARRDLRNHSPDGLEWGYLGSGPSQLSLALLADHFGAGPGAIRLATALYQDFKFALVARLPRDGWTLTAEQIGEELCRLATDDGGHFWGRVIGTLDAEFFDATITATGKDPDPAKLRENVAQIIARAFHVTEDFARTRVAEHYAKEGRLE